MTIETSTVDEPWRPRLVESGPVYLAITRALEADIRGGVLQPGERLPTHRDLATWLGVNVGTVTRAYAEARRRGLLKGEVGRGTFVAQPSGPALAPQAARGDRGLLDMSINFPLSAPAPDLAGSLHRLADRPDLDDASAYGDPAGSERARKAGARWLSGMGIEVEPDQIVVCAGSQHALLMSLASVVGPGEVVLAESLTYPGFLAAARMLGVRVRGVEIDAHGIVPEALEQACVEERPRLLYCMPSLQNPTACAMPEARRRAVAAIAREHDLTIVQDEIQAGMLDDAVVSLANLAPERVLTIAGLSKIFVPGLRVAFLAGARDRMARLAELVWGSIWMAPSLGAELISGWIEDGTGEAVVEARRDAMRERHAIAAEVLAGLDFTTQPYAYHLWLRLPEGWEARAFSDRLAARGVAVSRSESFMVGKGAAPGAVRVSLSAIPRLDDLRFGLETLAALARETTASRVPRL